MSKKRKTGFRLLKLKLADSAAEYLEPVGVLCRKARNAALEDWLLRQRGKPLSEKQAKPPQARKVKDKNGNEVIRKRDDSTESTKIYHAVTAASPELDTQVAAMLAQQLYATLNAKLDWRRDSGEERRRRSDAILAYEDRPPFFNALEIPVRSKNTHIKFGPYKGVSIQFLRGERREFEIVGELPRAWKLILASIADHETKLQDAKMLCKQDDRGDYHWYLYLPVSVTADPPADPARELVLMPCLPSKDEPSTTDRPFRCVPPTGKAWSVGDGRYLQSQMTRIISILKQIGWKYRQRDGAGHGRKKYDDAKRPWLNQQKNITSEFRRKLIVQIINQMQRQQCGTLVYREPSLPLRPKCWFDQRGLEWNWTQFETDLKNALARKGYEFRKEQLKWKEAFPNEPDKPKKQSEPGMSGMRKAGANRRKGEVLTSGA